MCIRDRCDASDAEKETRVRTGTRRVGRCTALKRDLDVRTGHRGADEAAGDDADTLANIDTSAARDAVCAFARSLGPDLMTIGRSLFIRVKPFSWGTLALFSSFCRSARREPSACAQFTAAESTPGGGGDWRARPPSTGVAFRVAGATGRAR